MPCFGPCCLARSTFGLPLTHLLLAPIYELLAHILRSYRTEPSSHPNHRTESGGKRPGRRWAPHQFRFSDGTPDSSSSSVYIWWNWPQCTPSQSDIGNILRYIWGHLLGVFGASATKSHSNNSDKEENNHHLHVGVTWLVSPLHYHPGSTRHPEIRSTCQT